MPRSLNWRSLSPGRQQPSKSVALWVSLAVAASLALIVYLTTTSVPFLATSATTDARFGAHNACLIQTLGEARVGFAVSPDGKQVAAYGGTTVAVCRIAEAASSPIEARSRKVKGIHMAAFDFDGHLWWVTPKEGTQPTRVWHWAPPAAPTSVADVEAVAITGFAEGVIVLDGSNKLLALQATGNVLAAAEVAGPRAEQPVLSVNAEGRRVMWSAQQGVFVYDARTLKSLIAESPCQVAHAWWLAEKPASLLLSCSPDWALQLDVLTGRKEDVARKARTTSVLVPRAGVYFQPCDALPCVAPPP